MKAEELTEMLKTKTPNQIINKHIYGEIWLNNYQLDKLLKMKEGTEEEGRGGVNIKPVKGELYGEHKKSS